MPEVVSALQHMSYQTGGINVEAGVQDAVDQAWLAPLRLIVRADGGTTLSENLVNSIKHLAHGRRRATAHIRRGGMGTIHDRSPRGCGSHS